MSDAAARDNLAVLGVLMSFEGLLVILFVTAGDLRDGNVRSYGIKRPVWPLTVSMKGTMEDELMKSISKENFVIDYDITATKPVKTVNSR